MATQRKTSKTSPGSSPVSHTNMDAGPELHIESHVEEKVRLSCCQKVTYAFPRGATTGMGLQLQQTVRAYYIDGLGVTPKALAMLIAICKCLDFLIGFGIGYSSDKLNTRWGRRKPFIAVMFPVWVFVMLMLFSTCTSVYLYTYRVKAKLLPRTSQAALLLSHLSVCGNPNTLVCLVALVPCALTFALTFARVTSQCEPAASNIATSRLPQVGCH